MENDTKKEYIEKGYNWNKVILYSNVAGILSGLLSTLVIFSLKIPLALDIYFLVFVITIVAYVTTQSFMTDLKILLINRKILRVAYLSNYLLGIINILTVDIYKYNWIGLLMFTGLLIFIFLFSPIGSSDVRLLAVGIPYSISIGGHAAIFLLIIGLLLVAVGIYIKRLLYIRKEIPNYKKRYPDMLEEVGEKSFKQISRRTIMMELNTLEKHAEPVGPFMIAPFWIYLMIYPFFI